MPQVSCQIWAVVGTLSPPPPSVVICKFRLTFRLGNYIWRFPYGFGVLVRDIWTWRSGFYSEFRCRSREHSGLDWVAILRKLLGLTLLQGYHVHFLSGTYSNRLVPKRPRQQGALDINCEVHTWMPFQKCMDIHLDFLPEMD